VCLVGFLDLRLRWGGGTISGGCSDCLDMYLSTYWVVVASFDKVIVRVVERRLWGRRFRAKSREVFEAIDSIGANSGQNDGFLQRRWWSHDVG
jgi:hypothetical protein